jgi:hypothetical protein
VEFEAKLGRGQAHSGELRNERAGRRAMEEANVHDDTIAAYAPAVREALALHPSTAADREPRRR